MISIVIPVHNMKRKDFFLNRCLDSIRMQSHQDYEIVIMETGKGMGHNVNEGIKQAKGDLIKILFMDDYLFDKDSLRRIADSEINHWIATACTNDVGHSTHLAKWDAKIPFGYNTLGSPSVITLRNVPNIPLMDESLEWLIDCDWYQRLFLKYGKPDILDDINVVIGIHDGQQTNLLSDELKDCEVSLMYKKYA